MNVIIIGCGLIGRKRVLALSSSDKLVACCDTNNEIAVKFGKDFSCNFYTDYKKVLSENKSDVVIVAVVNKFAKDIIIDSLKAGNHVVAEKPLGRNFEEAKEILRILDNVNSGKPNLQNSGLQILKTGFNHRFHPGIWKAKELVGSGKIGNVFNIRARYGHGGRPGMENEWRASKDLCGGGELLDQGVHIIDLIRWFGGDIAEVYGKVETKFWQMEVEDNAFAILKTKDNVTTTFQVSWTNWKNIFSFEIFGTDGYLRIEGLGGSYGPETLEIGLRKKEGGKPDIELIEFPQEDISWKEEWDEFKSAVNEKRQVIGSGLDGFKANEVIDAIYSSNDKKKVINLD